MSLPPSFQHPGPPPARPELPVGAPLPVEPPSGDLNGVPPHEVPAWAPFAGLVAAFTGVLLVSVVVGIVVGLAGGDLTGDLPPGMTIALTVAQDVILIATAWYGVRWLAGRVRGEAFGLRRTRVLSALGWAALIYVGFWATNVVVILVLGEPPEQDIVRELQEEDSLAILAGFAVLTTVVAPIAEELFFRGFMFRALAEKMRPWLAAGLSGAVFGLIHLPGSPLVGVVVLSVFGVGLALLFWSTGSLLPCIALHAAHNAVSFALTKELVWWGFLALVIGATLVSLAIAAAFTRGLRPRAA